MQRIALVVLALLGLFAADARAAPRLEQVGHASRRIVTYAEPGLEDIASDLSSQAETALAEIASDLPDLPIPVHIELRIVGDASDLAAVAPAGRGAPPWAVGVAYPDLGIVAVAVRSSRAGAEVDPVFTLRHELAHLALGAALGNRAPRWLHEGFAYQHSPEFSRERVETLAGMAWFDSEIPLHELDRSFPADELPAHRAYAESYDFVGYLANRGRWVDRDDDGDRFPFRRFLRELAHGASLDTAAMRAYGRPIAVLFDEWKDDLSRRYRMLPIGIIGFALWILAALLLVFAWWRRRRQNRRRLAEWEADEQRRREAAREAHLVVVPPYVPWPGDDNPFADVEPDGSDDDPPGPRLLN